MDHDLQAAGSQALHAADRNRSMWVPTGSVAGQPFSMTGPAARDVRSGRVVGFP